METDELSSQSRAPVRLDLLTWHEASAHIERNGAVILPTGSTEQHGPMGLIGTDALCVQKVAEAAAPLCGAIVAPTLAYAPAPFNTSFPGTVSVSSALFSALVGEILAQLVNQRFKRIFILNGHGANIVPIAEAIARVRRPVGVASWWDFEEVNVLRRRWYGDWEGMHATPSEVSITQAAYRLVPTPDAAATPPERLSTEFISSHSGDRHGPPDQHRAQFPDGRVGSHSALARPEHGHHLIDVAARAFADYVSAN